MSLQIPFDMETSDLETYVISLLNQKVLSIDQNDYTPARSEALFKVLGRFFHINPSISKLSIKNIRFINGFEVLQRGLIQNTNLKELILKSSSESIDDLMILLFRGLLINRGVKKISITTSHKVKDSTLRSLNILLQSNPRISRLNIDIGEVQNVSTFLIYMQKNESITDLSLIIRTADEVGLVSYIKKLIDANSHIRRLHLEISILNSSTQVLKPLSMPSFQSILDSYNAHLRLKLSMSKLSNDQRLALISSTKDNIKEYVADGKLIISPNDLVEISRRIGVLDLVDRISAAIFEKIISFPYKKLSLRKPSYFWSNVHKEYHRFQEDEKYFHRLPRFLKKNFNGTGFMNPKTGKVQKLIITTDSRDYLEVNTLPDIFTEPARMECNVNRRPSPTQIFFDRNQNKKIVTKFIQLMSDPDFINTTYPIQSNELLSEYALREAFYPHITECTQFRLTLSRFIYEYFSFLMNKDNVKVYDPFAGWGDRLLGAGASRRVKYYVGTDPNPKLIPGHAEITAFLRNKVDGFYKVLPIPAEDISLKEYFLSGIDIMYSSPPFFDQEIYGSDSHQSIIKHSNISAWNSWFHTVSKRIYTALNPGGYMIYHIADPLGSSVIRELIEYMYSLEAVYLGSIPFYSNIRKRPVFNYVWTKPDTFTVNGLNKNRVLGRSISFRRGSHRR